MTIPDPPNLYTVPDPPQCCLFLEGYIEFACYRDKIAKFSYVLERLTTAVAHCFLIWTSHKSHKEGKYINQMLKTSDNRKKC
jgi:hypothetical protein